MIERLGFTLHLDTGAIDYVASNPIVYQGGQSSYYLDFDFMKGNQRVLFDEDTFATIAFRRSDGNVSAPLLLERETENGEGTFTILSKLLSSNWFFYKAGNLSFTIEVRKRIAVDTPDGYTEQIITTANGYINVVASSDFDVSAPIPPSAYGELLSDLTSLDNRLDDLDTPSTGRVSVLESEVGTLQSDVSDLEDANMIKSLADKGTATTSSITIEATHYDGTTSDITVNLAGDMATEQEVDTKISNYNTITVQPKFNELDNELADAVHYDNLGDIDTPVTETTISTSVNVSTSINGKLITNIFESDGLTAKKAKGDKNGNDITLTYQRKLTQHLTNFSTSAGAFITADILSEYPSQFTSSTVRVGVCPASGFVRIDDYRLKCYTSLNIYYDDGVLKATAYYTTIELNEASSTILGTTIHYINEFGSIYTGNETVTLNFISDATKYINN